jgi:Rha family phage regulatory protein
MKQSELFPETLLVSRDGDGRIYTDSLRVARHFGKRHGDVIRAIGTPRIDKRKNAHISTQDAIEFLAFCFQNFEKASYTDSMNRERFMYRMTEEGFAFLAMGFTGEKAALWKVRFLAAFRAMERQLAAFRERESAALYAIRPRWKPIVAHPAMKRAALTELTGHKSPGSITACRRRMREVGLLAGSTA